MDGCGAAAGRRTRNLGEPVAQANCCTSAVSDMCRVTGSGEAKEAPVRGVPGVTKQWCRRNDSDMPKLSSPLYHLPQFEQQTALRRGGANPKTTSTVPSGVGGGYTSPRGDSRAISWGTCFKVSCRPGVILWLDAL